MTFSTGWCGVRAGSWTSLALVARCTTRMMTALTTAGKKAPKTTNLVSQIRLDLVSSVGTIGVGFLGSRGTQKTQSSGAGGQAARGWQTVGGHPTGRRVG